MKKIFQYLLSILVLLSFQTLALAQTQFTAVIEGGSEAPTPVESNATGTGFFELTDAGLRFNITADVASLSGPITAAHFHNASFGEAGGVVRTLTEDFNGNTASGTWTSADSEPLTAELLDELRAGNIYVNIHTDQNPDGEIRGQLVPSGRIAELDVDQTVPAATVAAGQDPSGLGLFTLTDAGLSYRVSVNLSQLSGAITAAHFHNGARGTAGDVVRTITDDFVGNTASGTWTSTDSEPLTAELIEELRAGNIYVNVHTEANSSGEIRGQIELPHFAAEFDASQAVPAPTTSSEATSVGVFLLTSEGLEFDITVDTDRLTGPITAAHFHNAAPGTAGDVVRTITTAEFLGNTASGIWTSADSEPLTADLIAELLAGNIYVNVHTAANPLGEIRGQIVAPSVFASVLPTSRSVQVGNPATAFASIAHTGSPTAAGCRIVPTTSVDADFTFQTTNPATNVPSGVADTAVDIQAGAIQTYFLNFTPTAAFAPTEVQFSFVCDNSSQAPVTLGLNTLLLSASNDPVPDIVALAATINNDGIVTIPGTSGTGVFSVATVNVGATGQITATPDTGTATLPVNLFICETNPSTGECLSDSNTSVTTTIAANATPTFAVFVAGSGEVAFDPANNRVFVRFGDAGGVTRGTTSVAVRSQ